MLVEIPDGYAALQSIVASSEFNTVKIQTSVRTLYLFCRPLSSFGSYERQLICKEAESPAHYLLEKLVSKSVLRVNSLEGSRYVSKVLIRG